MKEKLIDSYFLGTLTESEQHEFHSLLESDAQFKEEVDYRRDLQKVLVAERKDDLRRVFKNSEQAFAGKPSKPSSAILKYAMAACIALLLGVFGYFSLFNSPTPQDLFADNFEPYRNVIEPIVRSNDDTAVNPKIVAFTNYEKGNYKEASQQFKELYSESNESYYLFYQANTHLQLGETSKAIVLFKEHQTKIDEFQDKSKWYLALAFLQQEDLEKCKEILNKIVSEETYNHKLAAVILKEL